MIGWLKKTIMSGLIVKLLHCYIARLTFIIIGLLIKASALTRLFCRIVRACVFPILVFSSLRSIMPSCGTALIEGK